MKKLLSMMAVAAIVFSSCSAPMTVYKKSGTSLKCPEFSKKAKTLKNWS